ncbi:MAG: DNA repair protein RecO, partial [Rhodospirillales bacterium]|nr:DNA repair protein RecO [Rhodospirillales bacterium]
MEWTDRGIVLSARRHGERDLIIQILTAEHGRHAGLVKAGGSRNLRGIVQPGNLLQAVWQARLEDQLGHFSCEVLHAYAAEVLADPGRLGCLVSACAVAERALPERAPASMSFSGLCAVLESFSGEGWAADYVRWELVVLAEAGFGLDLACCAATGASEDLIYVSPKSGRAVSRGPGQPYRDKLLALPAFLTKGGAGDRTQVLAGL